MPHNNNPLTTEEMQRIDELLATGMSQKKIAQQVGRAQSTISLHAKRTGQVPVHRTPTEAIQRHKDGRLAHDTVEWAGSGRGGNAPKGNVVLPTTPAILLQAGCCF